MVGVIFKRATILIAALALAACGSRPPDGVLVYPIEPDAMRVLLKDVDFPYWAYGQAGAQADAEVRTNADGEIVWTLEEFDGADIIRYTAAVAPEASGSRITIGIEGPAKGKYKMVGPKLDANPTIKRLYLLAMQEEIAAKIENRQVRSDKIMPAMMAAVFANPGIFR